VAEKPARLRAADTTEDFDRVIEAATRVQQIVPGAVLVGGSASAIHCAHRFSRDDDHVVRNLIDHYDEVLAKLEGAAGWQTVRWRRPVLVLGRLDGVDTGIRNLIRKEPLETTTYESPFGPVVLPTLPEMARIKGALILTRNATRDYVDFVALADKLREVSGESGRDDSILRMDELYPQANDESAVRQLARQLAEPKPYDLGSEDLSVYRLTSPRWRTWNQVAQAALRLGAELEIARNRPR
jgi:hypothetical protein